MEIHIRPALICAFASLACLAGTKAEETPFAEKVTRQYVEIASARYQDSYDTARLLMDAIREFVTNPSEETHKQAKEAWVVAHKVYSLTEVFRFGNPNVDAWETKVNAWPIDEGFLDYVAPTYSYEGGNPHALYNLIASEFFIDDGYIAEARSEMDPKAGVYHGFTDNETNVATGYHTIEFLLWGQDLNQSPKEAGLRPYTDYVLGENGTGGNMDRRRQYLMAISGILLQDLTTAIQDWKTDRPFLYSKVFLDLPVEQQLDRMVMGMGSLSNGELAGERIQVALLASDQEEEQSCFSDTTHIAIYQNALSVQSLYHGQHHMHNGQRIEGPSLSELVAKLDQNLDAELTQKFVETMEAAQGVVDRAEKIEPFDRMIQSGNEEGRAVLNELISRLKAQTELIEEVHMMVPELAKQ